MRHVPPPRVERRPQQRRARADAQDQAQRQRGRVVPGAFLGQGLEHAQQRQAPHRRQPQHQPGNPGHVVELRDSHAILAQERDLRTAQAQEPQDRQQRAADRQRESAILQHFSSSSPSRLLQPASAFPIGDAHPFESIAYIQYIILYSSFQHLFVFLIEYDAFVNALAQQFLLLPLFASIFFIPKRKRPPRLFSRGKEPVRKPRPFMNR